MTHLTPPVTSPSATSAPDNVLVRDLLLSAIRRLEERQASFRVDDVIQDALAAAEGRLALDAACLQEQLDRLEREGRVLRHEDQLTTPESVTREQAILAIARRGREAVSPLYQPEDLHARLARIRMSRGQRQAIELILTTVDRIVLVQGFAGTGKTTMLKRAVRYLREAGVELLGLAPSSLAVDELRHVLGAAEPVDALQQDKALRQRIGPDTLLVVDEGSLLDNYEMHEILETVERQGARAVIMGDRNQFKAQDQGQPFTQLLDVAQVAVLDEIRRQRNPSLRRAVEEAAVGHMHNAFERLSSAIVEIPDALERYAILARDYVALSPADQQAALILVDTPAASRLINQLIREGLGLFGKGLRVTVLEPRALTREERQRPECYAENDLIIFSREYKRLNLRKNDRLRVAEVLIDRLLLIDPENRTRLIQPQRLSGDRFSVYHLRDQEFSAGDRVIFGENIPECGIRVGDRGQICTVDVAGRRLEIHREDGRRTWLDVSCPRQLDYGFCQTNFSAQGCGRDLILLEAASTNTETSMESFYVGVSRARERIRIYTDDRTRLEAAIQEPMEKTTALDVLAAQEADPPR